MAKALALVSHLILGFTAIVCVTVLAFRGMVTAGVAVPAIMMAAGVMTGGSVAIQKTEQEALMKEPPHPEERSGNGV